ncbi:MAG: alpha/beta hydrolase [Anaerolineae bacterium]|nr:alpha/beta hydrolase [Anaerolineae bacterium]MDW8068179.1 alpha/beta hydrolase [Anaerolineae bacterium]
MPVVSVGETTMFYTVSGRQGPAVVLIHGAGGSHLHWPAALRRLPGATVYAVDLPGHGRSGGSGRERIEEYAADIVRFLDRAGIARGVLVGHSMGGAIAQMAALMAPERVSGLVLVGTSARLRVAPAILEGILQDAKGALALMTEWAWGPSADPALIARGRQMMARVNIRVLWGDFAACDRFDLRERVGDITAPTLVITGSEDRMTPPKFGQWLAEQIPGARFVLVEGAGHMVMLERPEEVASVVREWLDVVAQAQG